MEDFLAGRCDRVCISRCHFHSMGRQEPMREQLLPFNRVSRANVDRTTAVDYILEPAPDTLLDALLPSSIRIILYNALLDSITAENAARMVAMQTATDNAEELSDDLTSSTTSGVSRRLPPNWRTSLPLPKDKIKPYEGLAVFPAVLIGLICGIPLMCYSIRALATVSAVFESAMCSNILRPKATAWPGPLAEMILLSAITP